MGLPEIVISFQQKASTAIQRSSRGVVAILLNDATKEQFFSPYKKETELDPGDWTESNLNMLKLVFRGGPNRVLAVRLVKNEGAVDLAATLKELLPINIDYLVHPGYISTDKQTIKDFINQAHAQGRKVKAVLPSCEADMEHIINFATPSVTAKWDDQENPVTYTGAQYCCRIAGILAGLPLTRSCTFYGLPEVVDAQLENDADAAVDAGKLIIVFDGDQYKLGRGVTSLVTVSDAKPEALKKIKIVEGMDVILHDIYSTFRDEYIGKVANSYDNKQMFVAAVNRYLKSMQDSVLDAQGENFVEVSAPQNQAYLEEHGTDTMDMSVQELKEANTGSYMFLEGNCKFLDAAEDLKLQMYM